MCKVFFWNLGILDFGFWILDFGFWGFWILVLDFGFWGSWILDFGLGILDGHLVTKFWMRHKKRSCARRPGSADFRDNSLTCSGQFFPMSSPLQVAVSPQNISHTLRPLSFNIASSQFFLPQYHRTQFHASSCQMPPPLTFPLSAVELPTIWTVEKVSREVKSEERRSTRE